jgi:hypothetical protein
MKALIQSLDKVSELWLNPRHPLREETIQALQVSTGFSRRQIEMALSNCFEELSLPKITTYVSSFVTSQKRAMDVFHILPSNTFTAWVHGAVITLLLGHRLFLKPSSREPIFARAWKKSLKNIDPRLAERVDIMVWDETKLQNVPAVVAYGSDETLQKIHAALAPGTRFAGYGHKLSVGIIFEEALKDASSDTLLANIQKDAEPFRLQGCLSPQILYVQNPRTTRWPELEAVLDVAPRVRAFEAWDDLSVELKKFTPYLSCVGYAGPSEQEPFLVEELASYHVSRVCPMGLMQRPPLSWQNGGINLVNLLN